jgi:peptidoglycan/LPS O-acetylase OafA/YrhL
MGRKKRLHYKDLDSLRFFAFIPVFLYCAFYLMSSSDNPFISDAFNALGYLKQNSVDFFFFLSSFLLTTHALREYKYNKSFSIKSFYIRRMMRIFPVLAVVLLFAFIMHPLIIKALDLKLISTPSVTSYISLFPNYFTQLSSEQYVYLAIVWTIYMFIQFYIFWGFILKFFSQQIKFVSIFLILVGIASRLFHILTEKSFEFDTLSVGISIGIGAIVGNIVRNDERTIEFVKHLSKGTHIIIYLLGIGTLIFGYLLLKETYFSIIVPLITSIFFGYVIIEQTYGKESIFKLRKSKFLIRMGKISYGLIVYQSVLMVIGIISIDSLNLDISGIPMQITFIIVSFIMAWIAADLSYKFFERPILSIKRDFKRS